jgi:hypothetical protein
MQHPLEVYLRKNVETRSLMQVLVWLRQPQFLLFFLNLTRSIQLPTKWPQLPHHWPKNSKRRQHPLEVYLSKNIYTRQLGAGLGWVGACLFIPVGLTWCVNLLHNYGVNLVILQPICVFLSLSPLLNSILDFLEALGDP